MRILHTSDWHLGRRLLGKNRHAEFSAWLDWLLVCIQEQHVDALIVAGDIFDTTTPSASTQALYYDFLYRLQNTCCRHCIIVGGNHDSATLLNAPRLLLKHMNIHVVGQATAPEEEILVLKNADQNVELVVCAVPYLHERDIRQVEAFENIADKDQNIVKGIQTHYQTVAEQAQLIAQQHQVPLMATGHLFMVGGKTTDDDGVRELYVGNEGAVRADIFPACFDYVALGHIHVPQKINGLDHIRYCGSPIAMGFGEAAQQKEVLIVEFVGATLSTVTPIAIPKFQCLARLQGDMTELLEGIEQLKQDNCSVWLEARYTGQAVASNLKHSLQQALQGSQVELLKLYNQRLIHQVFNVEVEQPALEDLRHEEVFERCLDSHEIQGEARQTLKQTYQEAIHHLTLE
ncbi:exonuclease SbcCD subunit D C-terminal domain-containing protein [Brackiella oedipodis]|uniref:exonuclease SbcCD subunit D C-terminal domain-containing protein n=1 Tax=Brackiella oedipodis TaxID=124225 RepID=UPI00048FED64|nr:exonuclease SbcCD subunit D C-terminal domain-containing protein [Brackiella oedipodis]